LTSLVGGPLADAAPFERPARRARVPG
jgi:hypothetical protein